MTGEAAAQRIAVIWSAEARADLRVIDRETAMQILYFWTVTWLAAPVT